METPEASADLSDFLPAIAGISVPFARENLHLVILLLAGSSRYLSNIQLLTGAIVNAGYDTVKYEKKDLAKSGLILPDQSFLIPRKCRVLPSFEPAFAGGSRPRNAALAQAYRVISIGVRDPYGWCWLKTGCATSRTQQGYKFYTIKIGAMIEKY